MAVRKPAKIDEHQVEELASFGLTDDEIAIVAGIGEATLQRRFDAALKRGRASLRKRLRKAQIDAALNGNPAMLIWLGKIYLGQRESAPVEQVIRIVEDRSVSDSDI